MVGRNTAQIEGDDAATGDYLYHTHDHLGSTRNVYAQNKDDAAAFEYTPYGRELFTTNRALTTRGYTGHTREAALGGGYYAPFRYYLPNLARWEKRDPLGMVDGPNVYGYVRGNPVNLWDPMGLNTCSPEVDKEKCQRDFERCESKADREFALATAIAEERRADCTVILATLGTAGCAIVCVGATVGWLPCWLGCTGAGTGAAALVCDRGFRKEQVANTKILNLKKEGCELRHQLCLLGITPDV